VTVSLPLNEVERILGVTLSADEIADILRRLQFGVVHKGDVLAVTVPDHRLDIGYLNDPADADIADVIGQADLIEEIARIYGYDRIPPTLIVDELPPQRNHPALTREEKVRDMLAKAGLQEIINYRLTTPEAEARLVPPGAESDLPPEDYIQLANPSSVDRRVMRHTVLNGMLETAAANSRWQERLALFEISHVYLPVTGQKLPTEPRHLGLLLTGERMLPAWQEPGDRLPLMNFYDLKGVVETLVDALHLEEVTFAAADHSTYFPGRVAALHLSGEVVGHLGELHPLVREAYELPDQPVMVAEFDLEKLLADVPDQFPVKAITNYPAVYQDIAVVVDENVPAADVARVIEDSGGFLLRKARLFDVYRGDQIGPNKKSLAYALTIQAPDKTLRDRDADGVRARIVKALKEKLNAALRE
jgi:phenylalanyl-tRNA synthetase beta chain